MVLDADALTSFEDHADILFDAIRRRGAAATVLTPHGGEKREPFKQLSPTAHISQKLEFTRASASRER